MLNGISLQTQYGKPVLITGSSGSGKTSLVEVLSGLSKPHKGTIYWNNEIINERQNMPS